MRVSCVTPASPLAGGKVFFPLADGPAMARISPAGSSFWGRMAGAEGRTRTADTYIFSVVLYQLSYLGPSGILAAALEPRQAP